MSHTLSYTSYNVFLSQNAALAESLAKAGEAEQALRQEVERLKAEGQKKPPPPSKPKNADPKAEAIAKAEAEERAKLQAAAEELRKQLEDANKQLAEVRQRGNI